MGLTPAEKVAARAAYLEEAALDLPATAVASIGTLSGPPFNICIDLPWGVSLCSVIDTDFPDCRAWMEKILGPLNALLGSIQPIFMIVDVLMAVKDAIAAVPESIMSLSPQPVMDAMAALISAVAALVCAVYPPFAWPGMIISIVNFLLHIVECVIVNVHSLCDAQTRISNLTALLSSLPESQMKGCQSLLTAAQANLDAQRGGILGGLTALTALLAVVNTFIQIANDIAGSELMPLIQLPVVGSQDSCDVILTTLETLQTVLTAFTAIIPSCP